MAWVAVTNNTYWEYDDAPADPGIDHPHRTLWLKQTNDGADVSYKDAYDGATAYIIDDAVTYLGSTYKCILAATGQLPTNPTYWTALTLTPSGIRTNLDGSEIYTKCRVVGSGVVTMGEISKTYDDAH